MTTKAKHAVYPGTARRLALRKAMADIFEEYGAEFVSLVVNQLRSPERMTPTEEWTLADIEDACFRYLKREGLEHVEGNVKFYIQMAHAIGKGRNPSELYAQLAQLEKVHIEM